jgi:class 3 adenylate cyclase/tetratricopeptide (TPR) repeat protein
VIACPSCGRENPDGFAFCGFCRAALPAEAAVEVRKTVTVLFTDLTGFTTLSERLDPETVRAIQGRFLHAMKAVAERHGGTVEKFIGDAVMVVFGVPAVHEDDALRAVRAAVEMREALGELNQELRAAYDIELTAHTGANTGEVVVEEGSAERLATGDAVNVAARLEAAAAPGEILIGEATYRLTRAAVVVEPATPLDLKGKAKPVLAYRVTSVDPVAEGYLRRMDTPLVGREEELAELMAAFERVASERRCELVTLVAPPGAGKSRLTNEFIERVGPRSRVLIGRCLPYGDGITFWPLAEAVKEAAGIRDQDTPAAAVGRIEALVADPDGSRVGARVAAAIGLVEGDSGSLQETFWAVRRLFEAMAGRDPVVFVVEDVHWAEPALLDLLEYLVEFMREHPVLLLCTARPELRQSRPSFAALGGTVELEPLGQAQSEALVRHLAGDVPLPEDVLRHVVTVAEGNPLFVEELVRKLVEDGSLVRTNAHWELRGEMASLATPGTISALLAARIDALADGERSTIQRGAVVGRVFWWGALESLAPETERPEVGRNLQTLVRRGLIHPDRSSFAGEDAFAFGHILVRDAAYDSMPKSVRADIHERFADWLDHAAGDRLNEYEEIIGYHLEQAVQQRSSLGVAPREALALRAGARLVSAGLRASAQADHAAAANLLQRGVALLPADAPDRAEGLAALGQALFEGGDLDEAVTVLDEAVAVAERLGDRRVEHLARIRRRYIGVFRPVIYDLEAYWAEAEVSLAVLDALGEPAALAEALVIMGTSHFWRGWTEKAIVEVERALHLAALAGSPSQAYLAIRLLGMAMVNGETPVDEALERYRRITRDLPQGTAHEVGVLRHLGNMLLLADDEAELRATYRRLEELATDLALWMDLATMYRFLGELDSGLGDLDRAEAELRKSLAIYERIRVASHGTDIASLLASLMARRGRPRDARAFAEQAAGWLSPGDVGGETILFRAQAEIALSEGDLERALERAGAAVAVVEDTGYIVYRAEARAVLARVLAALGRTDEARATLDEAMELSRRKGDRRWMRVLRGLMDELAAGPV